LLLAFLPFAFAGPSAQNRWGFGLFESVFAGSADTTTTATTETTTTTKSGIFGLGLLPNNGGLLGFGLLSGSSESKDDTTTGELCSRSDVKQGELNRVECPEDKVDDADRPEEQKYAEAIVKAYRKRHGATQTSATFTLGLRDSTVVVKDDNGDDTFTFRVDLVGSGGVAGTGPNSGVHTNPDGTKVPTPHLQPNRYRRNTPNGAKYVPAIQDAIPMTMAALKRIWPTENHELVAGEEITLRQVEPGQESVLQQIVDREERKTGPGMGKVVSVTFLKWG